MDLLSMLLNAKIKTRDGDDLGEVLGVHIAMGKLYITVNLELDDEGEDPDDGEQEDIPEDDASEMKFPKIVEMGKMVEVNG